MDSDLENIDIAKLFEPRYYYEAIGNTYPHREELSSCGWFWDAENKRWLCDCISDENDMIYKIIKDLPGVVVRKTDEQIN